MACSDVYLALLEYDRKQPIPAGDVKARLEWMTILRHLRNDVEFMGSAVSKAIKVVQGLSEKTGEAWLRKQLDSLDGAK